MAHGRDHVEAVKLVRPDTFGAGCEREKESAKRREEEGARARERGEGTISPRPEAIAEPWRSPDSLGEQRICDLGELETAEDSSRFEHAVRLLEYSVDVGAVANAERDGVEVERVVGYCFQVLSVSESEGDLWTCISSERLAL
jgi:hypothetical protein